MGDDLQTIEREAVRDLLLARWRPVRIARALKVHRSTIHRHRVALVAEGRQRESERADLAAALQSD